MFRRTGNFAPIETRDNLSISTILRFWAPLAATWLMMSIEGPALTAVIARLAEQKENLAAFGVAFNLGLFIESPVIMILSAATALVRDSDSLGKLRRFTYLLSGAMTLIMAIVALPPIFEPLARDLLNLPDRITQLAQIGTILLIPWPAAIGVRRFYQGVLIREGQTKKVAQGTLIRLGGMTGGLFLFWQGFDVAGVVVGTASMSIGVTAEAIAARFMVASSMRRLATIRREGPPLRYEEIIRFYIPLALTSMIGLGLLPMITLALGRGAQPIESLAIWPVVTSFVFLFRGVGLAWQEAVITLVGDRLEQYRPVLRFTLLLAGTTSLLLALVVITPFDEFWFGAVSDLQPELVEFALVPLAIMILLPASSAILSMQRGVIVAGGRNIHVSITTAIEVILIILLLFLFVALLGMVGAVAAAIAVMIGRTVAVGYLSIPFFRVVRRLRGDEKNVV